MNWLLNSVLALILVVVLSGTANTGTGPDGVKRGWAAVNVDGHQGVIVSADDAASLGTGADAFWMPTESDIIETEQAILAEQGDLAHMRQYAGIVDDGARKVFVNGFCNDFNRNWRAEIIAVDDGGECYFGAVYNIEAEELESFRFNGSG